MTEDSVTPQRKGEIAQLLIDDWQDQKRSFLSLLDTPEAISHFWDGPHRIDRQERLMVLEEKQTKGMRRPVEIARERRMIIAYEVVKFELRTDPLFKILESEDLARMAHRCFLTEEELALFLAEVVRDWHSARASAAA